MNIAVILNVLVMLFLTIVAIILCALIVKKMKIVSAGKVSPLTVISGVSLSNKAKLVLVQYDQGVMLLGVTDNQIQLLQNSGATQPKETLFYQEASNGNRNYDQVD